MQRADKLIVETEGFVPSGEIEAGDPRELKLHRDQPERDVPYLPTDQHVVNKMLEMAKVTREDVLYDLGCGDGRIVITAAKLGARAVGVEIDLQRLRECHDNLRNTGVRDRVEFRRESFFDVDLKPATVVALYLLPAINRRLIPKLMWELRPGARIVANYFEVGGWAPDEQIVFKHRPIMLWVVPAWVGGRYRCVWAGPDGAPPRRHAVLDLKRYFQFVSGTLSFGRQRAKVSGRVRGSTVELVIAETPMGPRETRVKATYDEGELRGHFSVAGAAGIFLGQRVQAEAHAGPAEFLVHAGRRGIGR